MSIFTKNIPIILLPGTIQSNMNAFKIKISKFLYILYSRAIIYVDIHQLLFLYFIIFI